MTGAPWRAVRIASFAAVQLWACTSQRLNDLRKPSALLLEPVQDQVLFPLEALKFGRSRSKTLMGLFQIILALFVIVLALFAGLLFVTFCLEPPATVTGLPRSARFKRVSEKSHLGDPAGLRLLGRHGLCRRFIRRGISVLDRNEVLMTVNKLQLALKRVGTVLGNIHWDRMR